MPTGHHAPLVPAPRGQAKSSVKPTAAPRVAVDDKRDAALLAGLRRLFSCSTQQRRSNAKNRKKVSARQLLHLARRLVIIAAAIRYLWVSFDASIASFKLLQGIRNAPMKFESYDTRYILGHSPFVTETLGNDTTPRPVTYFLESNGVVTTTACSTPKFHKGIYNTYFLNLGVAFVMRDTYRNVSEFATHEVVVPIVDCSFAPIETGDETVSRVFFLMRNRVTHDDILLVSGRYSMQDYKIPEQNERGPIGFCTFDLIRDMRETVASTRTVGMLGYPLESPVSVLYKHIDNDAQGWRVLETLPADPATQPPAIVFTARRTGFYISSDSEQANIKNLFWTINETPKQAISTWNWQGEPVLKDSWAWVHLFHVGFALDVIFSLSELLLIVHRNLQDGKIWLGDAFVSISSTLLARGVLIVLSWYINGFWSLMEFCLHDAHQLTGSQEIFFHPQIMRADLLTIFLGLCSVAGYLFRERIDPAFAIVVFEIYFENRLAIAKTYHTQVATMIEYTQADSKAAVLGVADTIAASIPMRQWTTHVLSTKNTKLIAVSLIPISGSLFVVMVYIVFRKMWSHLHRQKVTKLDSKHTAAVSEDESSLLSAKRTLTLFEIATGAELQNRFGVISDYENCIFIKGMKYASADGIYSNGFVIVSAKYVVSSGDLLSIMAIKALRLPLRVYAYELKGNTVQQTARLVARETFTWRELTHLNVMILS